MLEEAVHATGGEGEDLEPISPSANQAFSMGGLQHERRRVDGNVVTCGKLGGGQEAPPGVSPLRDRPLDVFLDFDGEIRTQITCPSLPEARILQGHGELSARLAKGQCEASHVFAGRPNREAIGVGL